LKPLSGSYRGRFAPSPTGPLHAGSLVAALASWLDARAHAGTWLVRIEDVDTPRCSPDAAQLILGQLAACGLVSDEPVVWQSQRSEVYQTSLDTLTAHNAVYICKCSRADIARTLAAQGIAPERHRDMAYPGTCRPLQLPFQAGMSVRFRVPQTALVWQDRLQSEQHQNVANAVGDFVLKRSDGLWSYQLAVVVDDAGQGITHVVRGEDLADNTPRQILLQQALGLHTPLYMHTPLVLAEDGQKLSKQNGAQSLDLDTPVKVMQSLNAAAQVLGLPPLPGDNAGQALAIWVNEWRSRFT
jgi:glutamyl-Q tRNA(Asp) synthetase